MSGGFELQPQDGGPRVALAPGETVIGRGPLLRSQGRLSSGECILDLVTGKHSRNETFMLHQQHKLHVLKMRHEDKAKGLVLIRKHSIQNQKIKEKGSTLYQYKRQSPVPIHETV
ncbi:aprataxin and PNK-like factor isoform X1 [Prionailurus iriomotensis]